ncbi:hypothetical protein B0O80DRAFT_426922 [Mortierella sp. GBAus27b]|nr:hypothetical protein B0O80DRAFT_426922 [Mortierella sp. GBAus27b]
MSPTSFLPTHLLSFPSFPPLLSPLVPLPPPPPTPLHRNTLANKGQFQQQTNWGAIPGHLHVVHPGQQPRGWPRAWFRTRVLVHDKAIGTRTSEENFALEFAHFDTNTPPSDASSLLLTRLATGVDQEGDWNGTKQVKPNKVGPLLHAGVNHGAISMFDSQAVWLKHTGK